MSILEGLWARGDRRLGKLLINAFEKGCRFDGWSDQFRFRRWEEAVSDTGIDIDFYTTRCRDLSEPLPWDHIDTRVNKTFLKTEWENAFNGEHTPDCRYGDCCACGVCDFTELKPRVYESLKEVDETKTSARTRPASGNKRLKICYEKKDQARYFGHLELKNIFFRAIRRAGISVKYSEGFHPMPKASFEDPLPIGMESEEEAFILTVEDTVKPHIVRDRLNAHLPQGLFVHTCHLAGKKASFHLPARITYRVTLKDGFFDPASLDRFHEREQWVVYRKTKKGKTKSIDLKEMIDRIHLESPDVLELSILSEPGKTIRPAEVITHIFDLPEAVVKSARIVKKIS
jgi:radical SAM-linked protein